ncbi:unnamed protein product, partial [Ixodes hexagonus]
DGKHFGVVHFLADDSVAVVHANWVEGSVCFWPNETTSKKLQALTKEGKLPELGWKEFQFASLGWYDSYEKARMKLPIAEEVSDLCSDPELGHGKRKKTRRLASSDSEVEVEEGYVPPKPPTPPCLISRSDLGKKSSHPISSGHEALAHSRSHEKSGQKVQGSDLISSRDHPPRRHSRSRKQSAQLAHDSHPVSRGSESLLRRQSKSPEWSSQRAHDSRSASRGSEPLSWKCSHSRRYSSQQGHGSRPPHHGSESSHRGESKSPEWSNRMMHGSRPVSRGGESLHRRQSESPEWSSQQAHGSHSASRGGEPFPSRRSRSPRHSSQQAHGSRASRHEGASSPWMSSPGSPEAFSQHVHSTCPVVSGGEPHSQPAHTSAGAISGQQWNGFMMQALKLLHMLKQRQQQHSEQLTLITSMLDNVLPAPTEAFVVPPLKSLEDFLAFEKVLAASKEKRLQLRRYLAVIGGDDAKEKASRIIRKLLSHDIAVAFTWYGTKDKRRFCDLHFCQMMCGVLTEKQNEKEAEVTLKDIERTAMTWMRHAKERLEKCRKG